MTCRILTIAGSDSGGGAGIQADLKTITVLGGFGMSVITALTAQNTLGVAGVHDVPVEFVALQFDAVASDIGVDAAKTGMLASADIIRLVSSRIKQFAIDKLVVDPVMIAKGGAPLIRREAVDVMKESLIPLAFIVTPNIPEAEVITGMRINSVEDMKAAARDINRLGARNVVVKGGHLSGDAVDVLYDGKGFIEFRTGRIETKNTHGTGCTFSAALATFLGRGMPVAECVKEAKLYITGAIEHALEIGGGHGPTNHLAPLLSGLSRKEV